MSCSCTCVGYLWVWPPGHLLEQNQTAMSEFFHWCFQLILRHVPWPSLSRSIEMCRGAVWLCAGSRPHGKPCKVWVCEGIVMYLGHAVGWDQVWSADAKLEVYWSVVFQREFEQVKTLLYTMPVLASLCFDRSFQLYMDASHVRAGSVWMQAWNLGINLLFQKNCLSKEVFCYWKRSTRAHPVINTLWVRAGFHQWYRQITIHLPFWTGCIAPKSIWPDGSTWKLQI